MPYDYNYPPDNEYISQLPLAIRTKADQLKDEQIVDAGKLQGFTAAQLDQSGKFNATTGHRHTGAEGDAPKIGDTGLLDGAATDMKIGNRTIDDTQIPTAGNTSVITTLFSWLANRIKAITGSTSWRETPATTLATANNHIISTGNPHNTTAAQVSAVPLAGGTMTGNLSIQKDSPRLVANRTSGGTGQYSGIDVQEAGTSKASVFWDHVNGLLGAVLGGTFYELWTRKQWPGRVCLVIDDTQAATTATTYTVVKSFRWHKHSGFGQTGKTLKAIVTLWGSVNTTTYYLRFQVKNSSGTVMATAGSVSTSSTSEAVKTLSCDISSLADGLYTIEVSMYHPTGTTATANHRYLEFNLEY